MAAKEALVAYKNVGSSGLPVDYFRYPLCNT